MTERRQRPALGTRMHTQGFALKGKMEAARWQSFLCAVAEAMGMTPTGHPAMWKYPLANGAGGTGITLIQPITESFLAIDIWPDHGGAYLQICSCKFFSKSNVIAMARQFGLVTYDATELEVLELV